MIVAASVFPDVSDAKKTLEAEVVERAKKTQKQSERLRMATTLGSWNGPFEVAMKISRTLKWERQYTTWKYLRSLIMIRLPHSDRVLWWCFVM